MKGASIPTFLAAILATACASAGPTGIEAGPGVLVGGCGPMPGLTARYVLPFTAGETYSLTQGNCGRESHDGRFRYAFDFRMPAGTPVVAARSGTVVLVRDDRPDGTGRIGDENLVIIEHADGPRSRYVHLRQHGARIVPGDSVAPGDTIALSGNSGRSAFPHLHVDVADRCDRDGCRTVPVAFLNAEPSVPIDRGPVTALPGGTGAP